MAKPTHQRKKEKGPQSRPSTKAQRAAETRKKVQSGKSTPSRKSSRQGKRNVVMVFSRRNYVLMVIGVLAIVIGYVIMRMENEVDGFISLYIAPVILLAGYLEIIYAILWRPKEKDVTAS